MKNNLKKIIDFWKAIWGKLIAFIVCGSIVALFIASFCLKKELTLSVMNEWVSLVVGMAALVLGIISLFLSFYNVEQSNDVQKETIEIMTKVKEEITEKIIEIEHKIDTGFGNEINQNAKYKGSIEIKTANKDWTENEEAENVRG